MRMLLLLGLTIVMASGCGRSLIQKPGPMMEEANASIPPGRFRVLAAIAGAGDTRLDLQVSATVRLQLNDSGFTVVKRAGRWEDHNTALQSLCAQNATPVVDGVVFAWHDRLELRDCASGTVAYQVSGSGDKGITDMTNGLIRYLRRSSS
jgi:hypothetical protein